MKRTPSRLNLIYLFLLAFSGIFWVVNGQTSYNVPFSKKMTDDAANKGGNWTVGNCILASFSMDMTIYPNNSDKNASSIISVPATATVVSDTDTCNNNETQQLKLSWTDIAQNGTILSRNLTINFHLNKTDYGINRIYGKLVIGVWNQTDEIPDPKNASNKINTTVLHSNTLSIDTGDRTPLLLKTPIRRSYLCKNPGVVSLSTHLINKEGPPLGEAMKNTTISSENVRFDAFRGPHVPPNIMQTSLDCNYQPNDIVPIGVGCALAVLVAFVLTAYLIGRRRVRQRGYQSV